MLDEAETNPRGGSSISRTVVLEPLLVTPLLVPPPAGRLVDAQTSTQSTTLRPQVVSFGRNQDNRNTGTPLMH